MRYPKRPELTLLSIPSLILSLALTALITLSCDDNGDGSPDAPIVGKECVETDLMAQCPIGTLPLLEADAEMSCSEEGSVDVNEARSSSDTSQEVDRVCAGSGSCRIVCELQNPCLYGIERLSREEIVCAAAPIGTCNEESTRCYGDQLQSCDLQGRWEDPRPCPSGSVCSEIGGNAECMSDSVAGVEVSAGSDISGGVEPLAGNDISGGVEPLAGADDSPRGAPCESAPGGCPDLDFVRIEGGSFIMGDQRSSPDSNEIPIHNVNVPTFEMMRTEITVAQYRTCVNAGVCSTSLTRNTHNWSNSPSNKEDHPMNGVSWYQLMEFAAWVGARLPTEAEWEYAARGQGQDIIYPWGDGSPTCSLANYSRCVGSTSPVCSTSGGNTIQGLCDMAGNVLEWVQDEWHNNYNGAPSDGSGWCSGICPVNASDSNYNTNDSTEHVLRGGHWSYDIYLRAAGRDHDTPINYYNDFGGRLARSLR